MGAAINPCGRKTEEYKPVMQIRPQPPPSDGIRAGARLLYARASYPGIFILAAVYGVTLFLALRAHRDESSEQSWMLMDYIKSQTSNGIEIDVLVMGIIGCLAISLVGLVLGMVSIFCRSKCGIALLTFQEVVACTVFMALSFTLLSYATHYGPMVNEELDTQCMPLTAAPTPAPVNLGGIAVNPTLFTSTEIPSTTWWQTSTSAAAFFESASSSESATVETSSELRKLEDSDLVQKACADFGNKKWCADHAAFLRHLCEPPENGQAGTENVSGPFNQGLSLTKGTAFLGILAGLVSFTTSLFLCCLVFDLHTNRSALDLLMPAYLDEYDAKRGNSKAVYQSAFKPPSPRSAPIRYPQQSQTGYPTRVAHH